MSSVMDDDTEALEELAQAIAKSRPRRPKQWLREACKRTELAPDAPAPRLDDVIADHGQEPTARALEAWEARVRGEPIIHVAHSLGLSIEAAKQLIKEVHTAIHEDLKENLALNRQLDLARVDGLLKAFYPSAAHGDIDSANVTLKALQHRAKLTGVEPMPDAGRSNPQAVLVWIQAQLPQINRIVDSMPVELPPAAP